MSPGPLSIGSAPGAIAEAVRAALDPLLPAGARAVVAVSGGADSAGLAVAVTKARPDLDLVAVHVRHGLRDDGPDAKAASGVAEHLGLDYREERVEVIELGEGPEAAARAARYAALGRVAAEVAAVTVLTGHTAEDQAETVLLNLFRGAGPRGLSGMAVGRDLAPPAGRTAVPPVATPAQPHGERSGAPVSLVRPLLAVRRADVRALAAGLATVEDPTNADPGLRRARVRHEVLPLLADVFADPVGALVRTAGLVRADDDALGGLARAAAVPAVRQWGGVVAVRIAALDAHPDAVATRVLRRALAQVRGDLAGITAADLSRVTALGPGQGLDLPGGVRATAGGGWLAFAPAGLSGLRERPLPSVPAPDLDLCGGASPSPSPAAASPSAGAPPSPAAASPSPAAASPSAAAASPSPGAAVPLEELGLVLHVGTSAPDPGAVAEGPPGAREPCVTVLSGRAPFTVRGRRPGDRIRLAGGTRSLQDLYVDAGVPRPLRELVPVVLDADGTVRWVAGIAAAVGPGSAQSRDRSLASDAARGPVVWLASA